MRSALMTEDPDPRRAKVQGAGQPTQTAYLGHDEVIFPSTAGTLRDLENFAKQWRATHDELGVPEVSSHSFRKTVATPIDDAGLSARIGADHLGHAKVSMSQDRYMSHGRVHQQVAELLEQTVKFRYPLDVT
jgi:integrase